MTVADDIKKEGYNKFTNYSLFPYNCISYLIDDDESEIIWKLLYYNTPDAWGKSNLTKSQKGGLIYAGQADQTLYRVFLDTGMDDAWTKQSCLIRISPLELFPRDYVVGSIRIGVEVYAHFDINHLTNYTTRVDSITEHIISAFNGQVVEGLGRLYFHKTTTVGRLPFKGKATIFNNWIA